jgi:hypothetical protein
MIWTRDSLDRDDPSLARIVRFLGGSDVARRFDQGEEQPSYVSLPPRPSPIWTRQRSSVWTGQLMLVRLMVLVVVVQRGIGVQSSRVGYPTSDRADGGERCAEHQGGLGRVRSEEVEAKSEKFGCTVYGVYRSME